MIIFKKVKDDQSDFDFSDVIFEINNRKCVKLEDLINEFELFLVAIGYSPESTRKFLSTQFNER